MAWGLLSHNWKWSQTLFKRTVHFSLCTSYRDMELSVNILARGGGTETQSGMFLCFLPKKDRYTHTLKQVNKWWSLTYAAVRHRTLFPCEAGCISRDCEENVIGISPKWYEFSSAWRLKFEFGALNQYLTNWIKFYLSRVLQLFPRKFALA